MTMTDNPFKAIAVRNDTGEIMATVRRGNIEQRRAYYLREWLWGPDETVKHAAIVDALNRAKARLEFMEAFPGETSFTTEKLVGY